MTKANQDITNAVVIPGAQAAVSSVLVGAFAGAGAALLGAPDPAGVGVLVGSASGLYSWFVYRSEWARRVNVQAGVLDELRAANQNAATINLHVISENGRAGDYLDNLPGGRENLLKLAKGITTGAGFTTREWCGPRGYKGDDFAQLRNEFIKFGYLGWKTPHDHRGGVYITRPGYAMFRHLAEIDQPNRSPAGAAFAQIVKKP